MNDDSIFRKPPRGEDPQARQIDPCVECLESGSWQSLQLRATATLQRGAAGRDSEGNSSRVGRKARHAGIPGGVSSLLGTYRYYDQLIGEEKAVKDVIAQLRLACRVFDEAMMHLHHMPPLAKTLMQQMPLGKTPYGRHDDPMFARLRDLLQISDDIGSVLATIQKDFAPCKGRQTLWHRDLVLTDICESAKAHATTPLTWKAAGELAHSILIAAEIEVPADLPETLRIVRRVRKLRNKTERHNHPSEAGGR